MHSQRKTQIRGSTAMKSNSTKSKSTTTVKHTSQSIKSHSSSRSLSSTTSQFHSQLLSKKPIISKPLSILSKRYFSTTTPPPPSTDNDNSQLTTPTNSPSIQLTPNQLKLSEVAQNEELVSKVLQDIDKYEIELAEIKNPNFLSPFFAQSPPYKVTNTLPVVTEVALQEKIKYEAKIKASRKYRTSEWVREHQPQTRAAIVAIPSALALWATHDLSMHLSTIVEQQGYDLALQAELLMGLGAAQALVAVGLIVNANKILSLAGQPAEPVIQDIIRRTLRNKDLHAKVGGHIRFGHFVSLSTQPGRPRFWNNKEHHHQEWLAHDNGKFSNYTPDIAFPNVTQKVLNLFPFFKKTQWNQSVEQRVASDMKKNPQDYLVHYDPSIDIYEADEPFQDELMKIYEEEFSQMSPKLLENSPSTDLSAQSSTLSTSSSPSNQAMESGLAIPSQVKSLPITPSPTKTKTEIEHDNKMRKVKVTSYNGWERYWKPRRLSLTAHIVGTQDEGLLVCEVEKLQYGPSFRYSGGMTQYKVFQFISLKTGEVTNFDQVERPSLLTHAHITSLFDTLPADSIIHSETFTPIASTKM